MFLVRLSAAFIASAIVSGCAALNHWSANNVNINGAQQLAIDDEAARRANLITLLIPPEYETIARAAPAKDDKKLYQTFSVNGGPKPRQVFCAQETALDDQDAARTCLERAAAAFETYVVGEQLRFERRNFIVGRLILASNAECSQFTQHLNSIQADANLFTGTIASGTGAAGAIVSDTPSARILSGVTAFFTGARAELNADIFYTQAVPGIVKAIDSARLTFKQQVLDKNRDKPYAQYGVWEAMADVVDYNNLCSLVQGLTAINKALTVAESPGLDEINRIFLKTNLTQYILQHQETNASIINPDGTGNSTLISSGFGQVSPAGSTSVRGALDSAASALTSAYLSAHDAITALAARQTGGPLAPASNTALVALDKEFRDVLIGTPMVGAAAAVPAQFAACQASAATFAGKKTTASVAVLQAANDADRKTAQTKVQILASIEQTAAAVVNGYVQTILGEFSAARQFATAALPPKPADLILVADLTQVNGNIVKILITPTHGPDCSSLDNPFPGA